MEVQSDSSEKAEISAEFWRKTEKGRRDKAVHSARSKQEQFGDQRRKDAAERKDQRRISEIRSAEEKEDHFDGAEKIDAAASTSFAGVSRSASRSIGADRRDYS